MKGRRQETRTQRNTYGWQTPTDTPDIQTLRAQISRMGSQIDPMIQYEAQNARQMLENRFNNPYGANHSPETRDAIRYNQNQNINQRAGVAMRDSRRRAQLAQIGAQGGLAQMTGRRLVQTGGSGTSTMTGGPGPWGAIAGGALSGAGSAIA